MESTEKPIEEDVESNTEVIQKKTNKSISTVLTKLLNKTQKILSFTTTKKL